jgi:hypothetical protein
MLKKTKNVVHILELYAFKPILEFGFQVKAGFFSPLKALSNSLSLQIGKINTKLTTGITGTY